MLIGTILLVTTIGRILLIVIMAILVDLKCLVKKGFYNLKRLLRILCKCNMREQVVHQDHGGAICFVENY
jgi:hypothetical protein